MDDRIRVLREDIADALAKIEHQFDRIKALDERLREIEREDAEALERQCLWSGNDT